MPRGSGAGDAQRPELIKDHVTLTVECVDRLYLNAYVPCQQSEGG
jgi:hypothetical protein